MSFPSSAARPWTDEICISFFLALGTLSGMFVRSGMLRTSSWGRADSCPGTDRVVLVLS